MRIPLRRIIGIVATLGVVSIALFLWHIRSPRIIARVVTPDGIEMCLVQRCNWSGELFTSNFVYRKPGEEWRRFYYDHQDGYWGHSRASLDTNAGVAVFYRGHLPTVTFDWKTGSYTLHRYNRNCIDTDPDRMPAGWSPQLSAP